MKRLIISAPFGNYWTSSSWLDVATPTLGTYTLEYRGGWWYRLWRILRTVRYYPGIKAWKNKLGLPNPGIARLVSGSEFSFFDKIISISARNTDSWITLTNIVSELNPLAIELNLSCPNCGDYDQSSYNIIFNHCNKLRWQRNLSFEVIVKLPPINYLEYAKTALANGINSFHCCNSLPIDGRLGGLSGKPLKALSLDCVKTVKQLYEEKGRENSQTDLRIIGGGGITHQSDVDEYFNVGATNVAVASVLFNPFNWKRIKKIGKELL